MVSLGKLIIYGLVGAFALSALIDPARASGTVAAFGGIGTALGSLGGGVQSLLTGVGTGSAKLFNPLFTLRDLIYGPQAGVQTQLTIRDGTSTGIITNNAAGQEQIQLDPNAPITYIPPGFDYGSVTSGQSLSVPFGGGLANVSVHGQNLALSQDAINYYQAAGVTVSPQNPSTVSSQNSGNAQSAASTSSGYSSGAITSHRSTGGFGAAN